jgi:hypothetical protein
MAETDVHESIGEIKATAKAAHQRLDKLEFGLREDLKNISDKLAEIEKWMHKSQGWAAAALFIGTTLGSVVSFLVNKFF